MTTILRSSSTFTVPRTLSQCLILLVHFIKVSINAKLKNSDRLSHVEKFGVPNS